MLLFPTLRRYLRQTSFAAFLEVSGIERSNGSCWQVQYKKRFQKSGGKVFTCMDHGGVPSNRNNAEEHTIKPLA